MHPYRIPGERPEAQRARIAEIASAGEVGSLAELMPFLPPESHELGESAADAANLVLRRSSPTALASFDGRYRSLVLANPAPAWKDVRLGTSAWARRFPGVVALASFHRNGFVREAAVKLLADVEDGFELPFLLIRANDWNAEVQSAALRALSRRIAAPYTEHLIRSLALLGRIRNTQRRSVDVARLVRRIETLLLEGGSRTLLASAIMHGELGVRRASLRLASTLPAREARPIVWNALCDSDPVIAIQAAQMLLGDLDDADAARDILGLTRSHRLTRIRLLALEAANRRDPASLVANLRDALLDDARAIREVARHALSQIEGGDHDFATFYLEAVRERRGRERMAAFEGLAERAQPERKTSSEALALFLEHQHHPHARMRSAAIIGLGRIDGSNQLDALTAALQDPSSVVRRAALPHAKLYLGRGAVPKLRRR